MAHAQWQAWQAQLAEVMQKDRFRLSRQLHAFKAQAAPKDTSAFLRHLEKSCQLKADRAAKVPVVKFDEALPINQRRADIAQMITQHQVIVLCGETGSGKTTQLPKICLSIGRGVRGMIGHTQPRRIAARSVAHRIGAELGVGKDLVACKMRFTDQSQANTLIKVMTDGILLAETQSDRFFDQYDTLIIDEAHERSLNIDFLLGYLKQILPKRPDLKVIITSATIDPERFSKHFNQAPMIEVSGRTYPVDVRYLPDEQAGPMTEHICYAVEEIDRWGRGDMLVFLSGEREIRDTAEALRKMLLDDTDILPLYARLNTLAQQKILEPGKRRRIILATNVAETSITVPGIRYVIDPGFARISRYSVRNKVQRLPIEKISQASANQRKGRCGRVSAGICVRLYTQEDFDSRPEFTDPEIQRTNLASVILQLLMLRLGDIREFPFIEPPEGRYINDGFKLLYELGAVTQEQKITALGRQLAKLPMDPRLARMLIAADRFGALKEVLVIVSGLSIQDPKERPLEHQQAADQKHEQFVDQQSDFLGLLKLWDFYHAQAHLVSKSQLRKICQKNFVSHIRMREWLEVHRQVSVVSQDLGLKKNEQAASYDAIHQALLSGLLSHIAMKEEKNQYMAAQQRKISVFPGSSLFGRAPKWLVSATLLETTKLFGVMNAKIDPAWVEPLATHLLKRTYSEPYWQVKTQQVGAYEQVSLMGLVLVTQRRVCYGPIDPVAARTIFIREALVGRKMKTQEQFFKHYETALEAIDVLESKSRRRDILLDESAIAELFDAVIPADIYSSKGFHQWYRQAKRRDPALLCFSAEQLMQQASGTTESQFPNQLCVGEGIHLNVTYQFSPGKSGDGVNIWVPLVVLPQLQADWFDWLVPGLLQEKVIALIRGLPKSIRTSFVPVPESASAFLSGCQVRNGSLHASLSEALYALKRVRVSTEHFKAITLSAHLQVYFNVLDAQEKTLAQGYDLAALQASLSDHADHAPIATAHVVEQSDWQGWEADFPERVECEQSGVKYWAYPALVEAEQGFAVKLFPTLEKAEAHQLRALETLTQSELAQGVNYLKKELNKYREVVLIYPTLPQHPMVKGNPGSIQASALVDQLVRCVIRQTVLSPLPKTREVFQQALAHHQPQLVATGQAFGLQLKQMMQAFQTVRQRLKRPSLRVMETVMDCQQQVAFMLYPGFLLDTPSEWLQRIPVYLKAIQVRLDKAEKDPQKDRAKRLEFEPLWARYAQTLSAGESVNVGLLAYRWQLEELRLSYFAQPMKTCVPVSKKRLDALWAELKIH